MLSSVMKLNLAHLQDYATLLKCIEIVKYAGCDLSQQWLFTELDLLCDPSLPE